MNVSLEYKGDQDVGADWLFMAFVKSPIPRTMGDEAFIKILTSNNCIKTKGNVSQD